MWLLLLPSAFACEPVDVQADVQDAYGKLFADEAAAALSLAVEARDGLGCPVSLLYDVDVATLYWVGATAARLLGQDPQPWLGDAARMAGTVPWNHRLGDAAAWEAARTTVANDGPVHARSDIWLDGRRLAEGSTPSVPHGTHLVQWFDEKGLVHSELAEVVAGQSTELGPPPPPSPQKSEPVVAPHPSRGARIALWVTGGALVAGAGGLYYASLNAHESDPTTSETTYDLAIAGLGLGVATLFVPSVLLTSDGAALSVSGRF